jgi:hypothetical protein
MSTRKTATTEPDTQDTQQKDESQVEEGFEPVLEIDTLIPQRPTARIKTPKDREGKLYEMRLPAEFGVEDEQRFRSEMREFSRLIQADTLTKAERQRLVARVNDLCHRILVAPPEVLAELNDRQRQAVITHFSGTLFAEDAAAVNDSMQARMLNSIMES